MERIEFVLGPSKGLLIYFSVLYFGGIFLLGFFTDIPLFIKSICIIALLFSYYMNINLYAFRRSKQSITLLWQDSQGRWGCQTNQGKYILGILKKDSFISQFIIVVRIKARISKSVIVPRDCLSLIEIRALRNRLNQH